MAVRGENKPCAAVVWAAPSTVANREEHFLPGRPKGYFAVFNLFPRRTTKDMLGLEGSEALMQKKEKNGFEILTVKDEKAFYTLIEERLERQGFTLLDTFTRPPQQAGLAGIL